VALVTSDREYAPHYLFREIETDFVALARLIERAIEHLADDQSATEPLRLAKEAAERGASLVARTEMLHRGPD
jgi:hypothetical protein